MAEAGKESVFVCACVHDVQATSCFQVSGCPAEQKGVLLIHVLTEMTSGCSMAIFLTISSSSPYAMPPHVHAASRPWAISTGLECVCVEMLRIEFWLLRNGQGDLAAIT